MLNQLSKSWDKFQFGRRQQLAFLEDITNLVDDGVPVNQAIETIAQIAEGVNRKVALSIAVGISSGQSFADSMQEWFARPIIEVIRAGETAGSLSQALKAAIQSYGEHSSAVTSLITALLYPITVLGLASIVLVFVKDSVLSNFLRIRPISVWPPIGQTLYSLANFVQHWWWLVIVMIVIVFIAISRMLATFTGTSRKIIDQIPVLALYREIAAARLMENLGLLLTNGVLLRRAIQTLQQGASPYIAWHLLKMEYRLSGGKENVGDVLDTDLINKNDIIRLRVIAKGKGFDHALLSIGRHAHRRNTKMISITGKILAGILLALGALTAITIVIGIYSIGSILAS